MMKEGVADCDQWELTARGRVLAEAATWLKTPFHFGARVKGVGVDCAQFIAAVFGACEIFQAEEYGYFGADWHQHATEEHYRYRLVRHAVALPVGGIGRPGDIALVKSGEGVKVFSAGGIVVAWPKLIHACPVRGVAYTSAELDPLLVGWETRFFDPFTRKGAGA